MKVEILIYAYLAICAAMIVFNIVCIFVFRRKDRNMRRRSADFTKAITRQLEKETVDEKHKKFLRRKLQRIQHMMAFDETLEKLYAEKPEQIKRYISQLTAVFVYLTFEYGEKNKLQAAYYPYIIKKYSVFKGVSLSLVTEQLLELVKEPDVYCRENALQALYSIGDAPSVLEALKILNREEAFHHGKMITDGLLCFEGDTETLDRKLWEEFDDFSDRIKKAILDYFRFSSDRHKEKMLEILKDPRLDRELRFSAIRYFGKYAHEPALACLRELAVMDSPVWEYRAITAAALGTYPSDETQQLLQKLLTDRNWYVRYNAAESLERLGARYDELIEVFEGKDRYAAEMLRYRFDRKKLKKKEGAAT